MIEAFTYFRRMDYAGVIILVTGSGISPIYYGLYCSPKTAQFYLTTIFI
jgi:predicted membrane channel-forming protein YqfA (hemolysin III family)